MMKKYFLTMLVFLSGATAFGQAKSTDNRNQIWTGYFNQTRFSDRWGAWVDVQLRTKDDFFSELSTLIFRPGITYYLHDNTKLTAGYGYIRNFPVGGTQEVVQPEHRPWQQVQWHTKYAKLRTMQYLRLEERYRRKMANDSTLAKGYHFNFRVRYNFLLQIPLVSRPLKKGDLSLILNDEVHVNFGKEVVNNYFDQNRLFAGLAIQLNGSDNLQIGYLNQFVQLPAGNRYRNVHAARIFLFHNLDLRKTKSP